MDGPPPYLDNSLSSRYLLSYVCMANQHHYIVHTPPMDSIDQCSGRIPHYNRTRLTLKTTFVCWCYTCTITFILWLSDNLDPILHPLLVQTELRWGSSLRKVGAGWVVFGKGCTGYCSFL